MVVDIIDSKFDKYYSIEYTLSILIGVDSFFYFIEDNHSNALVLKQIRYEDDNGGDQQKKELTLQKILMSEQLLQLPYAKVSVCYSSPKFTIIPEEIFSKHQLKNYLNQITRVAKDEEVTMCRLSKLEAVIVYSVEKVVVDVAKSYFPGANHVHIMSPLIMQSYQHALSQKGYQVYIHVGKEIMGIVLFKENRLQLANTYRYESSQDFLYNTLLIYDQFGLDPETIPVMLSGRAQKKSALYETLQTYLRHVHFIQSPSYYQYGPAFQDVSFHYYHDLLSMRLCV